MDQAKIDRLTELVTELQQIVSEVSGGDTAEEKAEGESAMPMGKSGSKGLDALAATLREPEDTD